MKTRKKTCSKLLPWYELYLVAEHARALRIVERRKGLDQVEVRGGRHVAVASGGQNNGHGKSGVEMAIFTFFSRCIMTKNRPYSRPEKVV